MGNVEQGTHAWADVAAEREPRWDKVAEHMLWMRAEMIAHGAERGGEQEA